MLANPFHRLKGDSEFFRERLLKIERNREDLNWRRRKIEISQKNVPDEWCIGCVENNCAYMKGLLACCDKGLDDKNEDDTQLTSADYENIMAVWEDHFLEHLKSRSIHDPEEPALHFFGSSAVEFNITRPRALSRWRIFSISYKQVRLC